MPIESIQMFIGGILTMIPTFHIKWTSTMLHGQAFNHHCMKYIMFSYCNPQRLYTFWTCILLYFRFEPVTTVSNTSPSHTIQYPQRRQTGYNSIKYKLIENKGVFAEHCAEFNTSHRVNIYLSFVQLKYLKTNLPIRIVM